MDCSSIDSANIVPEILYWAERGSETTNPLMEHLDLFVEKAANKDITFLVSERAEAFLDALKQHVAKKKKLEKDFQILSENKKAQECHDQKPCREPSPYRLRVTNVDTRHRNPQKALGNHPKPMTPSTGARTARKPQEVEVSSGDPTLVDRPSPEPFTPSPINSFERYKAIQGQGARHARGILTPPTTAPTLVGNNDTSVFKSNLKITPTNLETEHVNYDYLSWEHQMRGILSTGTEQNESEQRKCAFMLSHMSLQCAQGLIPVLERNSNMTTEDLFRRLRLTRVDPVLEPMARLEYFDFSQDDMPFSEFGPTFLELAEQANISECDQIKDLRSKITRKLRVATADYVPSTIDEFIHKLRVVEFYIADKEELIPES